MAILAPTSFVPGGGDVAGLREDLSDMAPKMITPDDAPYYKACRKTKATAMLHEYTVDILTVPTALPTPPLVTAEPDFGTTSTRTRKGNRIQIFEKTWKIARLQEILAQVGGIAGLASEIQREIEKQMKNLAMQIEAVLLSAQAAVMEAAPSTPGKMAGFFDATSGSTTNATNLSSAALTTVDEGLLKSKLLAMYKSGASANLKVYMAPEIARVWSETFLGRPGTQVVIQASQNTVPTMVKTYAAPVGGLTVDFVPDRTIAFPDGTLGCIAIADHKQVAVAELEPIEVMEVDPNNQRNRAGWVETALTHEIGAEAGNGGWYNTATKS